VVHGSERVEGINFSFVMLLGKEDWWFGGFLFLPLREIGNLPKSIDSGYFGRVGFVSWLVRLLRVPVG